MEWWVWVTIGVGLLIAEILTPVGFFLFFFGIGALLVAGAVAVVPSLALWAQLFLFALLSIAFAAAFRDRLRKVTASEVRLEPDALVGREAIAQTDIPTHGVGKVELRGSFWNATNGGAHGISAGDRCRVTAVSGVTLTVTLE